MKCTATFRRRRINETKSKFTFRLFIDKNKTINGNYVIKVEDNSCRGGVKN